ncbi:MAG TPA: ribbon-helix-helix protein, CopG family [Candidatus Limnocylindria bacterium]|nr:ribbon-helix-helix protein, CopG family [Candidatus Limnocylindria bacterium]
MRTTVTLDRDIAAEVQRLRRTEGIGPSEALNRLARAGLGKPRQARPFRQRSAHLGELLVDVTDVAEALDIAEGLERR